MGDNFYAKDEIGKLNRMRELKKDLFDSFFDFDKKVFADGALNKKTKELIALGCAHVTRCPWCIDAHVKRAKEAGASEEEIAEAVFVSAAMNAGAAMAHSCVAMGALSETR